jgi:putative tricarboxylic transport membrane protein
MTLRLRLAAPYAVVLAIAVALYYVATHFQYTPRHGRLGPDAWPRAVLVLMMGVCAFRMLTILRRPRDEGPGGGVLPDVIADAASASDAPVVADERHPVLLAIGIALTVAYVYLMPILGFATATVLYLATMIRTGRYARWRVILPTALLGSLVFMFAFMKIVYLSLPIGRAPFDAVSLALMRLMGIR